MNSVFFCPVGFPRNMSTLSEYLIYFGNTCLFTQNAQLVNPICYNVLINGHVTQRKY